MMKPETAIDKPQQPYKRLFFALELDSPTREALGELSDRLQKGAKFTGARLSWVPKGNFHVTLVFLGGVSKNMAFKLAENMTEAVELIRPFEMDIRHISYFPEDDKPPRVIWAGVYQPPEELIALHSRVRRLIRNSGMKPPMVDFTPHVTLARIRSTKDLKAFQSMAETYRHTKCGKTKVSRLTLMESITGKGPAIYKPWRSVELPTNPPEENS